MHNTCTCTHAQGTATALHLSVDNAHLQVSPGDANQLTNILPFEDAVVPRAKVFAALAQSCKSNLVKVICSLVCMVCMCVRVYFANVFMSLTQACKSNGVKVICSFVCICVVSVLCESIRVSRPFASLAHSCKSNLVKVICSLVCMCVCFFFGACVCVLFESICVRASPVSSW